MSLRVALLSALFLCLWAAAPALTAQSSPLQVVQGQIEDAHGVPVPSALVQLSSWRGDDFQTVVSDVSGAFSFLVHSQGPFVLTVMTTSGTEQVQVEGGNPQGVMIRVNQPERTTHVDAAHSVVSVNDLEASSKAKSKLRKANEELQKNEVGKAWDLVNQAIKASPHWGRPYVLRGVICFVHHDYDSARADLRVAVAADPKNTVALTQLAKVYATTGNLHLAQLYFQRALAIAPVEWPTYLEASVLDLKMQNYTGALNMATHAMKCQPGPPPTIHYYAAEAAYHLGKWVVALSGYKAFLALTANDPAMQAARLQAEQRVQQLAKHKSTVAGVSGGGGQ